MFRLFECFVNKTYLGPETQVTKVSNTYHQLKKKCSFEGPVFHFELLSLDFRKSIFHSGLQLHYLLGV